MNTTTDDTYYDPQADWRLIPVHMHGGVRRYVMHGVKPGSFMHALFANDFMEAAGRADDANLQALPGWAIFIHNYVPSGCFGSPEHVNDWIAKGGINGKTAADKSRVRVVTVCALLMIILAGHLYRQHSEAEHVVASQPVKAP